MSEFDAKQTTESLGQLLQSAHRHCEEGDAQGALPCLQEAIELQREWQAKTATLERELRFSMALMVLLFFTGIWGFWRSSVSESVNSGGQSLGGSSLAPPSMPTAPKGRANPPTAKTSGPSVTAPPTPFGRTQVTPPLRLNVQRPVAPPLRRKQNTRKARPSDRIAALDSGTTPKPRRKRRLRFGDPALPSEVPLHWCGQNLRYGPYYPCIRRDRRRRCMKRSRRPKYGCLRIRR